MPAVEFNVHCKTVMGEKVVVVGNGDAAGLWDPQRSLIKLDTNSEIYPCWAGTTTDLPKGFTFEYKFAVLSSSDDGPARWEQLPCNRSLEVPDIAAKLLANFDSPNEKVELACADQILSRTDALEDADAATSATPVLSGTAPAGMTMATGVELACADQIPSRTDDLEVTDAATSATPALSGTAPAGLTMAVAPAMEATYVYIEAAKAKEGAAEELDKLAEVEVEVVKADKVEEAPGVAAESTHSARAAEALARAEEARKVKAPIEDELAMGEEATKTAKVQKAPKAQEELACADQIPSATDALEVTDAAKSATPALSGTAPAGMTMATASAMEATNVKIEAAPKAQGIAKVAKVSRIPRVCLKPGCGKPSWDGRADYCCTPCKKWLAAQAAKVVEAVSVAEGTVKAVPAPASPI